MASVAMFAKNKGLYAVLVFTNVVNGYETSAPVRLVVDDPKYIPPLKVLVEILSGSNVFLSKFAATVFVESAMTLTLLP